MKCPKACDASSRVIDSREVLDGAATRRRRQCRRRSTVPRPAAPAADGWREIVHLRAAIALLQRDDLPTEAGLLAAAALARDWTQCEQLEALAIVFLARPGGADA